MARSLGLTAYRAMSARADAVPVVPTCPRPAGELVWLHAPRPDNLIALYDLAARICTARTGVHALVTSDRAPPITQPDTNILSQATPGEHPDAVAAFLDHWKPDFCLWTWGDLRPNVILEAQERGCAMALVDADQKGFDTRRDRWWPDLSKKVLRGFPTVMARDPAAQKRLTQLGVARTRIEMTAPLQAGGQALPCADSDLLDLSQTLGARPVWFAAGLQPEEVDTILHAHRAASRLSHRLLLILSPAEAAQAPACVAAAQAANFDTLHWEESDGPDETTQVMVAEDMRDRGLFFRVAPVSFLGSSLVPGHTPCDPLEAAALGSAILYGPKVRAHLPSYTRLAAAGAARIVNDADALGTAVTRLIAPDQAAGMAHAGWDVISAGAALTDQIVELVQDALDDAVTRGGAR